MIGGSQAILYQDAIFIVVVVVMIVVSRRRNAILVIVVGGGGTVAYCPSSIEQCLALTLLFRYSMSVGSGSAAFDLGMSSA